ncbi:MAG TPA: hypothetical protein VGC35_03480 [Allosphingosinicella sp.]|jgi:hypothetical protein
MGLLKLAACVLGAGLLSAPVAAAAGPAGLGGEKADERICKASLETGSLVKKRKQCFTRKEWERIIESQQRGTRQMIEELEGKGPQGN